MPSNLAIYWLSLSDVERIHRRSVQSFGGPDGIRDAGLLKSALARPHNLMAYEDVTDIHEIAASYAQSIVKNHPFIDGNKRTAFFCAYAFLRANGFILEAEHNRNHTDKIEALAQSKMSSSEMAEYLREHTRAV